MRLPVETKSVENVTFSSKEFVFLFVSNCLFFQTKFIIILVDWGWWLIIRWCSLSICDIEFFNFHNRKVRKFKILKLSERNQNYAVIFWNHRAKSKFCGHILKSPKAKVNKVHRKWMKGKKSEWFHQENSVEHNNFCKLL